MTANRWTLKLNWSAETQTKLVFEEIMKTSQTVGTLHKTEREKTIATWQGRKPKWIALVRRIYPSKVKLFIIRGGEIIARKKWLWLDEGTKVRFMHVSRDWQSKTEVNVIGSGPGRGHITGLDVRFPLPGIKARNWNLIINKKLSTRFERRLVTAIKKGLKRRRSGKFAGTNILHG